MFHGLALRLGLAEPNVHDVVEKLIDKYFENWEYINFTYTDKRILVNNVPTKLIIRRDVYGYNLFLSDQIDTFSYRNCMNVKSCDCRFITDHLSEIKDILEDMAKNGKAAYDDHMKKKQENAVKEEQKKQQEQKCLTKMWRYLE